MYEDVNDPYYTGNPAETLRQVIETWEEYEALRGMPDYPDLFPEDIKFDVPGFDVPETFDTNALGLIFDETPQDTIVSQLNHLVSPSSSLTLCTEAQSRLLYIRRRPELFEDF